MLKRGRQDSQTFISPEDSEKPSISTSASVDQGNIIDHQNLSGKYRHVEEEEVPKSVVYCSLPPHSLQSFTSYEEHDIHYQKYHVNRCSDCSKNFPTEHFLNLHIAENHDPIRDARKERGEKTYACFVEDCDKTCLTWQKRRMHLVDKHYFPKEYDFFIVNDGMDQRTSMLRTSQQPRRRSVKSSTDSAALQDSRYSSTSSAKVGDTKLEHQEVPASIGDDLLLKQALSSGGTTANEKPDVVMDDISGAMSSLKLAPPSVRFGKKKGGQGFAKR